MGDWKGVRQGLTKGTIKTELYELSKDIGESDEVADQWPKIVEQVDRIMAENHTPSKLFPIEALDGR